MQKQGVSYNLENKGVPFVYYNLWDPRDQQRRTFPVRIVFGPRFSWYRAHHWRIVD